MKCLCLQGPIPQNFSCTSWGGRKLLRALIQPKNVLLFWSVMKTGKYVAASANGDHWTHFS